MTSKEAKLYKQLMIEAVMEGVLRALHTVKITTYTISPMSTDYKLKDAGYQVFEDLWENKTISTKTGAIQDKDRCGDLPQSSPPPSATTNPQHNLS